MKNKLNEIIDGWGKFFVKEPNTEKIAMERAEVCSSCEHNVINICDQCGCPLAAKTRSKKSKCPKNKW